jgi:nicotinamidase/pyrazinamidase
VSTPSTTLLVVDVPPDFCEGGALAVPGGDAVAEAIARLVREGGYGHVVTTQDWHVDPGPHFSAEPDLVDSWPPHCRAGSPGAALHPALPLDLVEAQFRKGAHAAAYSGFEASTDDVADDGSVAAVGLAQWLAVRDVAAVDVVGIATDHCVRATALDAVSAGFATRVLLDLTAGVAADSTKRALDVMRAAGVTLVGQPVTTG